MCGYVQTHIQDNWPCCLVFLCMSMPSAQCSTFAYCRPCCDSYGLISQYLNHALELKESYKLLKPHVEGLLVQVGCCAMCKAAPGAGQSTALSSIKLSTYLLGFFSTVITFAWQTRLENLRGILHPRVDASVMQLSKPPCSSRLLCR